MFGTTGSRVGLSGFSLLARRASFVVEFPFADNLNRNRTEQSFLKFKRPGTDKKP
jgi:hypothetical protein